MASTELNSDDNKKQELNDLTTCCICTGVYTDPKALPCIHTFCMKCIQETGLKTNKEPGDEMPCPICRQLFKIPIEGFHGLPKNFFIERLLKVAHVSDSSAASRTVCDACLEDENEEMGKEIPSAAKYCVDCKRKLCEECCIEHRNFKLTKKHEMISMTEYESGQIVMEELAPGVCELHEQNAINVYCTDCKTVVCAMCFIDDHKNHDGSHVNKFVADFRKQIESGVEAMNECRSTAEAKKAELVKLKEDIQERVKNLESDVEKRRDELMQLIDKHTAYLLQDLCSIRQGRMKEIQMEADDIDTYLSSLETYNAYCQNIMTKGTASDICCTFSDLSSRAAELEHQCQLTNEIEIQFFTFSFRKSDLEQFLTESCDNLIGEIHEEGKSKPKKTSKEIMLEDLLTMEDTVQKLEQELWRIKQNQLRYITDPVLIQTIRSRATESEKKAICGLSILDNELFVACEYSSEVEVYDSMDLSFSRRWNLKELFYPVDLGSCNRNKCLYIMDYRGDDQSMEILRVDPDGNLIKKWSTGDIWSNISVTDESNVILTDYDSNKLEEYSPEEQLINEVNLSSDAGICYVRHAIKLTNDLFVVSHGHFDAGVDHGASREFDGFAGCDDVGGFDGDSCGFGGGDGVDDDDDGEDRDERADDYDDGDYDGEDCDERDDDYDDDDDDYVVEDCDERDGDYDDDYDDDRQRVCIVDADGKVETSFGGERGSTIDQLNDPAHLFVDRNGFVLVADRGNSRVILLDSDLQFKREILSKEKHGLRHPSMILLDESNGRLFVADNEWNFGRVPFVDGRILIFDF